VRANNTSIASRELNEAVRRVELGLVRLNYAQSDPFDHDQAVGQPPVPLLTPVDKLLLTDRESDEEREIATLLVRRRNRIMHELAQVAENLRKSLTV
jgi:hypothetical protein